MALDTATLKSDLKTAYQNAKKVTDPSQQDAAVDALCDAISQAIEKWIKTGTVTVTAAPEKIAVQGSATAQANQAPVTLVGNPNDPTQSGGIS